MTSNREKINWKVPAGEWDSFLEYVREKYDAIDGHTGREVEMAMKEWVDRDEYHGIEERINRLVRAAGRTPEDLAQKKSTVDGLDVSGESTTAGSRVHSQLKTEFRALVNEHTDLRYGVALAHALHERRHGGRSGRLKDKLDRVIDDAEGLLSEVNDESDPNAGLSLREKRTMAICQSFSDRIAIQRWEIYEKIAAVAGDSDPTLKEYTDRVLGHLNYARHPGHRGPSEDKDAFLPVADARSTAESMGVAPPDAPAIDRKHYSDLSREEKIEGIQIELARQSQTNDGRYQFSASRIFREIFDDIPSPSHVNDLMHAASDPNGYTMARYNGNKVLRVTLNEVRLPAVKDALDTDESESEGNQEDESDSQNELRAEASEELDTLMNSKPEALTDGGIPE